MCLCFPEICTAKICCCKRNRSSSLNNIIQYASYYIGICEIDRCTRVHRIVRPRRQPALRPGRTRQPAGCTAVHSTPVREKSRKCPSPPLHISDTPSYTSYRPDTSTGTRARADSIIAKMVSEVLAASYKVSGKSFPVYNPSTKPRMLSKAKPLGWPKI